MTIGLIILALVSIMIFFGLGERVLRKMGLKSWAAFILVLALVIGAIVPSVKIAAFSVNVGAFIVPIIIVAILLVVIGANATLLRCFMSIVSVAAVAVAARMLLEPHSTGLILASSLIIGFVGGAVAFLVGQSRISALASAIGGIILGDIIIGFLYYFAIGGYDFSLGSLGVFDSIMIAAVFALIMAEVVAAIKRSSMQNKTARTALSAEAGEDVNIHVKGKKSGTSLTSEDIKHTKPMPDEYDDFFDDYL